MTTIFTIEHDKF